jgi:tRNA pseudouridine55 synthase
MNGLVVIDKPAGFTSHDVVNRWRKLAGTKRVGHLGTLDPMATGVLILVSGNATRLAPFFGKEEKTYLAEITFGLVSDTYDMDGQVEKTDVSCPANPELIHSALNKFRGTFVQVPPAVSAKKINGVPAYKLARKKIPVELKPVEVEIKRLDVERMGNNKIEVLITCSAGTYIRAIAHDLGEILGCGAVLSRLRRVSIGQFTIDQSSTLEHVTELAQAGRLSEAVIPSGCLLPQFPGEFFDSDVEAKIRQGRDFRTSPFVIPPGAPFVKALSRSGELIAIGELRLPNLYHPSMVL